LGQIRQGCRITPVKVAFRMLRDPNVFNEIDENRKHINRILPDIPLPFGGRMSIETIAVS